MPPLKKEVKTALLGGDFGRIVELAGNKRMYGALISMAYDKESLIAWRAIEAMGMAVGALSDDDPHTARDIVRRLLWSVTEESGSIGWSTPEMLAEVVASRPDRFQDLPPIILSLSDEPPFLRGVLWAMGRLAGAGIDLPEGARGLVRESLCHEDPAVRGMALWAASQMAVPGIEFFSTALSRDKGQFNLYKDRELISLQISDLASEVYLSLQAK